MKAANKRVTSTNRPWKPVKLRNCCQRWAYYITESMPVGRVEFVEGSGDS